MTLAGHPGGPPLGDEVSVRALADAVERALDDAGWERPHVAGNSLGGHLALQLAARDRASSVVAFAPVGGWRPGDPAWRVTLDLQASLLAAAKPLAAHADAVVATAEGRRRATRAITVAYEHIPRELVAHQLLALAAFGDGPRLVEQARHPEAWALDAERIACPVRIVWGTDDALLPWPAAAARYREEWLPHADWVVLDGVGHCPQLDVPLEAAQLILGFTG